MKIMVTGGRGFIGSHFVELALKKGHTVIDYDAMTYAAHESLACDEHPSYSLVKQPIQEITHLPANIDWIVNFAAESHVDNSIVSDQAFMNSNVLGVHNLLNLIRGKVYSRPKLLHISTDEVYGDFRSRAFTEEDKLSPSNPYSATKAAAEMLIMAYGRTYDIEYIITRSSNNYGERQYPEKLIPSCVYALENHKKIQLHGDGSYIRDWIRVEDNVRAIMTVLEKGIFGSIYNIGADNHLSNLQVARKVLEWFGFHGRSDKIRCVDNRLGQDRRYSIDSSKIRALGWEPEHTKGLHDYRSKK